MPANPERMRYTPLSAAPIVIEANNIVRSEAQVVLYEPNKGQAKYAEIFLAGIQGKKK